jgi:Zn-dependent protease
LRSEHAFSGGYTIVKDFVGAASLRHREMFVPLAHAAGATQADFGEALAIIGAVAHCGSFFTPLWQSQSARSQYR